MPDELIIDAQPAIPLTADRYFIGRGDGCDVLLPETDAGVSRRHALIERDAVGEWTVLDLSSRNGTTVNGSPAVGRRCLRHGDRLQIGGSVLLMNLPPTKPTLVTYAPEDDVLTPLGRAHIGQTDAAGRAGQGVPIADAGIGRTARRAEEQAAAAVVKAARPDADAAPVVNPALAAWSAEPMDDAPTIFAESQQRAVTADLPRYEGSVQPAPYRGDKAGPPEFGSFPQLDEQNRKPEPIGITSTIIGNKVSSECLASPGRRLAGYMIEVAIGLLLSLGAFGSFLTGFAGTLTGIFGMTGPKQSGGGLMAVGAGMIVISLVSGSLLIAYIVWDFMLMARGQTPGKKMLGMVVVSEDELRAGFWTMFLRQIILRGLLLGVVLSATGTIPVVGAALSATLAVLSNVWLLFDARRQQWYDKICKTYVIDMRNARAAYE